MDILWFFVPALIVLGIIVSYDDIKSGKIRNRWIRLGLAYSILVYLGLFIFSYFGDISFSEGFIFESLTNFIFSVIIGFGFWYVGIWTAGDGKLFIAFSALLPLSAYSVGYQRWIPCLTLLINIFIPSLVIIGFLMFIRCRLDQIKKVIKEFLVDFFEPKKFLSSVVSLFALFWMIELLLSFIGINGNYILRMLMTIVIFSGTRSIMRNNFLYVMTAVSLLRLFVDRSVFNLDFVVQFLILIFVWKLFYSFLRGGVAKLGQEVFSREMKVENLKKGMLLSETIQEKKKISKDEVKNLEKMPGTSVVKFKGKYYIKKLKSAVDIKNFIGEEAEGLTLKQIKIIKKIGFKKVKVSQTMPFAPFMFLGIVLTLLANGNILILVKTLFD